MMRLVVQMDEYIIEPFHSTSIHSQAYVLYLFLALLVAYLGDGDEQKIVELLEQQPRVSKQSMHAQHVQIKQSATRQ
jgi:hypothetical protein